MNLIVLAVMIIFINNDVIYCITICKIFNKHFYFCKMKIIFIKYNVMSYIMHLVQ